MLREGSNALKRQVDVHPLQKGTVMTQISEPSGGDTSLRGELPDIPGQPDRLQQGRAAARIRELPERCNGQAVPYRPSALDQQRA
jgi:hypothetical protein